jgi:hypothetical protein
MSRLAALDVAGHPGLLDALLRALAVRRDWPAVLRAAEGRGDLLPRRRGGLESYALARLAVGRPDGLRPLIDAALAEGRIPAVAGHHLRMRLAHAAGDTAGTADALAAAIRDVPYLAPLGGPPTEFVPVAGPPPALPQDAVACVIVARDAALRLPAVLEHHARLGVAHTVVIDNGSTDGTPDLARAWPDVSVLRTEAPFSAGLEGAKWRSEVADRWFDGRWVLNVDADETLVWCGMEEGIRALCDRLERAGAEGLLAPLVDLYPEGPIDAVAYMPGDPLAAACPFFDATGWRVEPMAACPGLRITGGVRARVFAGGHHRPETPPMTLEKLPLIRWRRGMRYLAATHVATPLRLAEETGALLHFKFLPDFPAHAAAEALRGEHWQGAREYRLYASVLAAPSGRTVFDPRLSRRYAGPESLAEAGLLRPPGAPPLAPEI